MNRFWGKKNIKIKFKYTILIIIILFIFEFIFISIFYSNKMFDYSKDVIRYKISKAVNNSFKNDILYKYKINDLIILNYNNDELIGTNLDIQKTYKLLEEVKEEIINSFSDNDLVVEYPLFDNNIFLSKIGPKLIGKYEFIDEVTFEVKTNVKDYGINSILIELYVNFNIDVYFKTGYKNRIISNNYNILISSKVINGELPNGLIESNSRELVI